MQVMVSLIPPVAPWHTLGISRWALRAPNIAAAGGKYHSVLVFVQWIASGSGLCRLWTLHKERGVNPLPCSGSVKSSSWHQCKQQLQDKEFGLGHIRGRKSKLRPDPCHRPAPQSTCHLLNEKQAHIVLNVIKVVWNDCQVYWWAGPYMQNSGPLLPSFLPTRGIAWGEKGIDSGCKEL